MSTRQRRGDQREVKVAQIMQRDGWLVASRRHIPGAGDLLAVHRTRGIRLIEVKSTAQGPYERFGPADRKAMRLAAYEVGALAWLAWWPPRGPLLWLREDEWPPR